MIDKEKVIKGLQIERECVSRDCDRDCGKCDLVQDRDWLLSVYDDALALLKEQKAITPRVEKGTTFFDFPDEKEQFYNEYYCGACGHKIGINSRYCSKCGKQVKWNNQQRETH